MAVKIILLIIGFVLLIKGADILIDGSSSAALNLKLSKIIIGLTIVAFGTSAPELAVSISARIAGSDDMVLGNIIGSSIMNTLLILGISSIIRPIPIRDNTIKKEIPLQLILSMLLVILIMDISLDGSLVNLITRSDALAILLFFSIFIYYLVTVANSREIFHEKPPYKIIKSLAFVLVGLAALIYGSDLVVESSAYIARSFGISERIISLTIIAFGTSLPELVASIASSIKGEQDLLLGNIIGSNIFNICIVLGIPVAIFGTITASGFNAVDIIAFIISAYILFVFARSDKSISRVEGVAMLLLFIAYYTIIFLI